ncbi:MAG: hypothetical protein NG784_02875 [Candidatus Jettenia sp.]|nr:hypothetical protein [Candidatus Jettenia sp.]
MKGIIAIVLGMFLLFTIPVTKSAYAKDGSQEVLNNLENFQKSLSGWMKNFDTLSGQFETLQKNVNESLTPLGGISKEIKGMQERLDSVLPRVMAIERSASVAEIGATLTSFNETLAVLKKLLSDLTKRVEDQEVKTAVLEKRYQEAQRPLEPIKKAIDDLSRLVTEKLGEQEKKVAAVEESMKTRVQSFEDQMKTLGDLQKQVKKLEKGVPPPTGTVTAEVVQAQPPVGTETVKTVEGTETAKVVEEERAPTPEEEGFEELGDDFYLRNVKLLPFGSSSQIRGEIKNVSDRDQSIVRFAIKIYNASDILLFTQDFAIKTFKKGEIRTFNEIISGYAPVDIAKYEIVPKGRY